MSWLGSYDDAYITYAYARNLAAGAGWTWAGVHVLGTSSPLFAALLALAERAIPLGIPVWGHLLSWLSVWAAAAGLVVVGRREGWPAAGVLAGTLWVFSPALLALGGSEYLPGIACVVAAAAAFAASRPVAAGIALAAAVGLRPELGLAAVALAVTTTLRLGRREGVPAVARTAVIALGLWGAWQVALLLSAGTCLPVTLAAKRAQADSGLWPAGSTLFAAAFDHGRTFFFPNALVAMLVGASAGAARAVAAVRRWPTAVTLLAWGVAHSGFVAALGVPYYHWYVAPTYFAVLLGLAMLVEPPRRLAVARPVWIAATATAVLAVVAIDALPRMDAVRRGPREQREPAYREAARWIDARYPPSTTVGSLEVGFLGYFGGFRTIDFLGLVNPQIRLDDIRRGDFNAIWRDNQTDLLLYLPHLEGLVRRLVGDPAAFARAYRLEHVALTPPPMTVIYRRASLPPRGEVIEDLTGQATEGVAGVRFVNRGELSALAVDVRAGAPARWVVHCERPCDFVTGLLANRGEARAGAAVETGDVFSPPHTVEMKAAAGAWSAWVVELPEAGGTMTLRVDCLSPADQCTLVAPHLRVRPVTGGTT